jgi:hypothetical protein
METILLDTMFDLPGLEGVGEVVISKQVIDGTAPPLYIYADRTDRAGNTVANACADLAGEGHSGRPTMHCARERNFALAVNVRIPTSNLTDGVILLQSEYSRSNGRRYLWRDLVALRRSGVAPRSAALPLARPSHA